MDYITIKEAANKWGISIRRVCSLCGTGKIDGCKKVGKQWIIPDNAKKPIDGRRKESKRANGSEYKFPIFVFSKYYNHTELLNDDEKELYFAEIDYLCGNYTDGYTKVKKLLKRKQPRYIKVGAFFMLAYFSMLLGMIDEYEDYLNKLKAMAESETEHKADFMFLYDHIYYISFPKEKSHNDLDPKIIRSISLDAIPFFDFTLSIQKTIGHLCGNKLDMCMMEMRSAEYKASGTETVYAHTQICMLLLYQSKGDFEECRYHCQNAMKVIEKNMHIGLIARCFTFIGNECRAIMKECNEQVYNKIEELAYRNYNNWKLLLKIKSGKKAPSDTGENNVLMSLVANGQTNQKIAEIMNISEKEVKERLQDLYKKFHISKRTELARIFIESCNQD